MTKADIVNLVFEKVGLQRNEAHHIVEAVFDTLKETLQKNESVKVSGFGTFNIRKKNARLGRNPKTKEEVEITPRRVITFKTSDQLREAVEKT